MVFGQNCEWFCLPQSAAFDGFSVLCIPSTRECDKKKSPKNEWIMCILCTPRPTYRSTSRPTVDRRFGRHIGPVSTDMSVDLSVECRSICRPRSVPRYIGRHIGRPWVDMSTDTRPICRSICRPRVVVRLSADMSIDRLPTFRRYFTATCVLVTVDII